MANGACLASRFHACGCAACSDRVVAWSMETYTGTPYTSKETEWYPRNCAPIMNVATPEWLDLSTLGFCFKSNTTCTLDFPGTTCKARKMVKAIAEKHGIYYQTGLLRWKCRDVEGAPLSCDGSSQNKEGHGGFTECSMGGLIFLLNALSHSCMLNL